MNDKEKKRPGLQKKTAAEIRESFNQLRDACDLDLRVLAGSDGRASVVTANDEMVLDSISGLTLCKAVEVASQLLRYQGKFHSEHVDEALRNAPPMESEDSTYVDDLESQDDSTAVAV